MLRNSPEVTDKPITKIINSKLDIKLGQFTEEDLNIVLTKIKNRKAVDFDEIPPEVWKTRKFEDLLFQFCNAVYKQNTIQKCSKDCTLPFSK